MPSAAHIEYAAQQHSVNLDSHLSSHCHRSVHSFALPIRRCLLCARLLLWYGVWFGVVWCGVIGVSLPSLR